MINILRFIKSLISLIYLDLQNISLWLEDCPPLVPETPDDVDLDVHLSPLK